MAYICTVCSAYLNMERLNVFILTHLYILEESIYTDPYFVALMKGCYFFIYKVHFTVKTMSKECPMGFLVDLVDTFFPAVKGQCRSSAI